MAAILGFLAAMGPLCTDFYLPALPDMAAELGSAPSQMQLSITACLLGLSLGQIALGPLSDARGRKIPLLLSLAMFILASFLCARASSVGELVALRFLQGLAGSGGVVLSRAVACDLFRGSELTRFFSLLMLINGVAPIFGPVIGGQILRFSDWSGIFFFLAGCGVLQFSLVFFGCPETLPPEKRVQGGMGQSIRAMFRLFGNRIFVAYMLIQGFVMAGFFGSTFRPLPSFFRTSTGFPPSSMPCASASTDWASCSLPRPRDDSAWPTATEPCSAGASCFRCAPPWPWRS